MSDTNPWQHTTVLLHEAIDALVTDLDGIYVDGTYGRGGHSRLLLSRLSPRGDEMGFALWQLLVVALGGTVALGVNGEVAAAGTVLHFDWALIAALAYLGILATGIGVGVQSVVQPQIRPTHVALMFATQP